jgi:hypothetical protein
MKLPPALFLTKLLRLAVPLILASFSMSCRENPTTPTASPTIPMSQSGSGVTWNAHPAICYTADTNIGTSHSPAMRGGLWVMDSTGLNWKCIYYNATVPSIGVSQISWPSWNPAGTSILWFESSGTNGYHGYLKKVDVSVINGVPVGSNVTTVYTISPSDSLSFRTVSWCPNSSNNVAVVGLNDQHQPSSVQRSHIRLVNMGTGSASEIYTSDSNFWAYTPKFSPDGSKIALIRDQFHGTYRGLQVIDLGGNVLNSLPLDSGISLSMLDWSKTSGRLAYGGGSADASGWISMIDTAAGSTSTAICTGLVYPSWSPTDWKIATFVGGGVLGTSYIKTVQVATGTIATIRTPGTQPCWRQ